MGSERGSVSSKETGLLSPPDTSDQAELKPSAPVTTSFDDNGNPQSALEKQEPLEHQEGEKCINLETPPAKPSVNIPSFPKMQNSFEAYGDNRFFINAATLEGSGEGERFLQTSGTSSVEGSALITSGSSQDRAGPVPKLPNQISQDGHEQIGKTTKKSRVPVSKSFPDIIQIAYEKPSVSKSMDKLQDVAENPLAKDSLEDIPSKTVWAGHDLLAAQSESAKALIQASGAYVRPRLDDIMTQSTCQTVILSEKPPEAWVIDFNSLSMDAETLESHLEAAAGRSSNSNSLAFFVNMDHVPERDVQSDDAKTPTCSQPDKKIFSMFVDIGEQQQSGSRPLSDNDESLLTSSIMSDASVESHHQRRSQLPKPSRLPVHRNVMAVLKDTDNGLSSGSQMTSSTESEKLINGAALVSQVKSKKNRLPNQYPSPRMQHKAAAEAALKAFPSHTTVGKNGKKTGPDDLICLDNSNQMLDASIHSNRSSLHVATEMDFSTSYISSMEMSGVIAEEPCSSGPCFKLGKDLLRMFSDGINTDVTITVNGRCLEAHKCILSSRSQYFAAMFSGGDGDIVNFDGFSFHVVHFTMCHIYSGTNEIPDTIDLLELATLTDLLGLEGLRENISQTIRVKFCHNFHRPCTGCIAGVLECFPIAVSCEMDELQRKMTKWVSKHFVRIWPTKAFASLGEDMIEKSLRYSVNHLSNDNILDITLGCDQLLSTMPSMRWTEPIFNIVNQLSAACVQFIGRNFSQVVQSKRFLLFGKGQQWNISRIEGIFVEAMELLTPDEACLGHTALSLLIDWGTEAIDEVEWSTMFVDFVKMLSKEIERYLLANASKVVLSKYWESLSQEVRKRICTASFLGYDKQGNKIAKPTAVSTKSKIQHNTDRPPSTEPQQGSRGHKTSVAHTSRPTSSKGQHQSQEPPVSKTTGRHQQPNAKIASVKPIQNVLPSPHGSNKPDPEPPQQAAPSSTSRRTRQSNNVTATSTGATRPTRVQKERSFTNSTRTSVASSTAATPVNALTPVDRCPGQPSSSTASSITSDRGGSSNVNSRRKVSSTRIQASNPVPAPPPPAPEPSVRKRFVTNSERANSVSKPTSLRPRTQPKAASSLTDGEQYHSTERLDSPFEKPRYASRHGTISIVPAKDAGNVVRKGNVTSSGASPSRNTPRPKAKPSNGEVAGYQRTTAASVSRTSSRRPGQKSVSAARNHDSPSHSQPSSMTSSTTNLMSRSTIETDSGEPKYRTLAQIGKSSTFSKDEPTVLGKIDPYTLDFS